MICKEGVLKYFRTPSLRLIKLKFPAYMEDSIFDHSVALLIWSRIYDYAPVIS